MDNTPKKRNTLPIKIGAGIVVLLIYVGVTTYVKTTRDTKPTDSTDSNSNSTTELSNSNTTPANPSSNNSNTATSNNTPSNTSSNTPTQPVTAYKNGVYNVTGTYTTPAGQEKIGFTMTVENDKISAIEAKVQAVSPTSKEFQTEFVGLVKSYVVGKNIADLNLGKVASSSLTTKGFNNALSQVKTQAKI